MVAIVDGGSVDGFRVAGGPMEKNIFFIRHTLGEHVISHRPDAH